MNADWFAKRPAGTAPATEEPEPLAAPPGPSGPRADPATRIERGELSRVDPEFRHRLAAARGRR